LEFIFATHNPHKLEEVRAILKDTDIHIIGLHEIGFHDEIVEDGDSFRANALLKAQAIYSKYGKAVFSEDSGLEVDALGGDPGVHTARYAGPDCNHDDNNNKLLKNLEGIENRTARFQSCICLLDEQGHQFFEGTCEGSIHTELEGTGGFGYDPIFIPAGYEESFGILSDEIKNEISHRRKSLDGLCQWLRQIDKSLKK